MTDQIETIVCPSCGAENPVNSQTCKDCGSDLTVVKGVINSATKHYNSALAMAEKNLIDHAIVEAEAAIELWDQNPHFHNLLGTLYAKKGLFDKAVDQWKKTLSLDPNMEKAANSIEKARRLELAQTAAGERRPYQIAVAALAVAAVLVLLWGFFLRGNTKPLETEIALLKDNVTSLEEYKKQALRAEDWFRSRTEAAPDADFYALETAAGDLVDASEERIGALQEELNSNVALVAARNEEVAALKKDLADRDTQTSGLKKELDALKKQPPPKPLIAEAELNKLKSEHEAFAKQVTDLTNEVRNLTADGQAAKQQLETVSKASGEKEKALVEIQKKAEDSDKQLAEERSNSARLRTENGRMTDVLNWEATKKKEFVQLMTLMVQRQWPAALDLLNQLSEKYKGETRFQEILPPLGALSAASEDPFEQEMEKYVAELRAKEEQKLRSRFAENLVSSVSDLLKENKFPEAFDAVDRAEAINPELSSTQKTRERIEKEQAKAQENAEYLMQQADLRIGEKNWEEAANLLRKVLSAVPDNVDAAEKLSAVEKELEVINREEAARTAARNEDLARVALLREQNRLRESQSLLLDLREIYEQDPEVEKVLAEVNAEIEARDRAVPNQMDQAENFFTAHQYAKAVEVLNSVLAWDDTHERARNLRDECEGRIAQIAENLEKARNRVGQQKYIDAKRAVLDVLRLDPENAEAKTLLQDIESSFNEKE
jgi:hypothetical protein